MLTLYRYMPEEMTPAAVTARVSAFVEADWRAAAADVQAKKSIVRTFDTAKLYQY